MSVYIPDDIASADGAEIIQQGNMLDSEHQGNMVERWSSRLTLRFVLLYEAFPCLWFPTHVDYKNKVARDKAVQGIIEGMGLSGFDVKMCRRKIRIIRSTYWNECSKINRSAKYGVPYKPKLSWFPQAHRFLSKIPGWKDLQGWNPTNVDPEPETEEFNGHEDQLKRMKTDPDGPALPSALEDISKEEDDPSASALFFGERDAPVGPSCAREVNEFDIFGKSVACQLRQLPLVDALEAQMEIQTLVSQRRLRYLRQEQHSGPAHAFHRQDQNHHQNQHQNQQNGPVSYGHGYSQAGRVSQGRLPATSLMDGDVGPLV